MQLRCSIFFCGVLALSTAMAQDAPATEPSVSKFTFGASFTPTIAYRNLVITEENAFTQKGLEFRNDIEEPRFAYGAALNCGYHFSRCFSLEGGIGYTVLG